MKGVKSFVVRQEVLPKSGLHSGSGVGAVVILDIRPVKKNGEDIKARNEMVECKPPKGSGTDGD